ncbi:hypothetical protein CR513_10235, partial [Mucuna pruriens]
MVTMSIDTLPSPYYDKVVGNFASNFVDLVVMGERIELSIKHGKFAQTSNNMGLAKKPTLEKKKGKTNVVLGKGNTLSYPVATYTSPPPMPYVPPYQPRADIRATTSSRSTQQGTRMPPRTLTLIPIPYTKLLSRLVE